MNESPRLTWLLSGAALLASASLANGCQSDERPAHANPPVLVIEASACIDEDQDGYGRGCETGDDCDDRDPQVTNACFICSSPHPGCPCDTEGMRAPCGKVESHIGTQIACGYGETLCTDGVYGECIINNSVTLLPGGDPKQQHMSLGSGTTCAQNPCDPYCNTWPDTPSGLGDPDAGTVNSPDGGLSLPLTDGGTTSSSTCSGGGAGSCAHHVCQTGSALNQSCDLTSQTCSSIGAACGTGSPCCYGLSCDNGRCEAPLTQRVLWSDDFSGGNAKGWSLDSEWEIGVAKSSSGHSLGYGDPSLDSSPGTDNTIAGVVLGGNADDRRHGFRALESPSIDTSQSSGPLFVRFRRWLNSDVNSKMESRVLVSSNGGGSWSTLYSNSNSTPVTDNSWQLIEYEITNYRATNTRIRFDFDVGKNSVADVSGWNLDDVEVVADSTPAVCAAAGQSCGQGTPCCNSSQCSAGVCTSPQTSCVANVCAQYPSCCTGSWSGTCVNAVKTLCNLECGVDPNGKCISCFKDGLDHDGDGFSYLQGDCKDCDPLINPGAFDFPGNGIDEDCSGAIDDEPTSCDSALSFSSDDPKAYAKAIDLCRFTSEGASGASRSWGVIDAKLVQADGVTPCSQSLQRAITSKFGANNTPLKGSRLATFSSGTARDSSDPGFISPNGQSSSYNANTHVTPPSGFPKSAAGCPNGTAANDSCGLLLTLRAPTNAKSFAYDFNFFSSEYAEWVCTSYNDAFVALYSGNLNPYSDKNISFDSKNNPVSVNAGFFGIPGSPTATSHPTLTGTGFDGVCQNNYSGASFKSPGICGGATGWLTTTAPIEAGETVSLLYSIWDTGDHVWDSTVIMDNFRWSTQGATIQTQPAVVQTPSATYSEGSFVRDYDASVCPDGTQPTWGYWSWTTSTPDDSSIEYYVRTADTLAGLDTAQELPLFFSNPPGPKALAGSPAVARSTPSDTQNGSLVVATSLATNNQPPHKRFLRVRSRLLPSSDKLKAPTLYAWNLEVSCPPAE